MNCCTLILKVREFYELQVLQFLAGYFTINVDTSFVLIYCFVGHGAK